MQIDPRHLEQLSVILDMGTLHAAAARLGTSQPALSRMIRTLEARTGIAIFEPASRPLRPTALGLELAAQGRAVRVARERAEEAVDFGARGFFAVLKIGAPPFLCERLVSEAIAGFVKDRPEVRIDLVPDYFPGLHDRLTQNQIDLIVGPARAAQPSIEDLSLEALYADRNVVVGRRGHPLLSRAITHKDLEAAIWIGHPNRSKLRLDMETALRLMGVRTLRFAFQSESAGAVLELLRESDFLTILPSHAVRADARDGLAVFPVELPTPPQTISIMSLSKRQETRLAAEFKAHLRAHVAHRYNL